jgi:Zn-dependent protease
MYNKAIKIGKIKTSKTELVDIAKAWLALSLAFTFAFSGMSLIGGRLDFGNIFSTQFMTLFIISLFTAGIGFLFHELGHKFVAQRYGCVAEFRAFDKMLYLAVGLAVFVGFIFAAPGAVMISGMITRKENGIISAAGPLVNYSLALLFLGLTFALPSLKFIFSIGFMINLWLGLFNMIPFGNFDGIKILGWNRYIWSAMVAFGVYFLFFF